MQSWPANRYPHPATRVPHKPQPGWRQLANKWTNRPWRAFDLILWACVVAWALMDIVTTAVGLKSGSASEANHVGALAYNSAGAVGLLEVKVAVLLAIAFVWVAVPWQWRRYVRAGAVAGGTVTLAAVAHNAWILLAV